jgi:transposase, IS30 family
MDFQIRAVRTRWPPHVRGRSLNCDERIPIADRLREGASIRAIAAELGRAPSSISREVRRNAHQGSGAYRPHAAQARAGARRRRPRSRKLAANAELQSVVQGWLEMNWSPEQISHMLRIRFPGRPEMHVCHQTIYQALYIQGRGALRRELVKALRTGRTYRNLAGRHGGR